jgi:hypothetical protein
MTIKSALQKTFKGILQQTWKKNGHKHESPEKNKFQ